MKLVADTFDNSHDIFIEKSNETCVIVHLTSETAAHIQFIQLDLRNNVAKTNSIKRLHVSNLSIMR